MRHQEFENNHWVFPEIITFESVADYSQFFEGLTGKEGITFDLSHTESIHSSFIGFLIHAKHMLGKDGAALKLRLSFTAERILIMLNILDYFGPEVSIVPSRKTA